MTFFSVNRRSFFPCLVSRSCKARWFEQRSQAQTGPQKKCCWALSSVQTERLLFSF